jgi:hypothetical protein
LRTPLDALLLCSTGTPSLVLHISRFADAQGRHCWRWSKPSAGGLLAAGSRRPTGGRRSTGAGGAAMAGEEGLTDLRLVILLQLELLQEQVRPGTHKGVSFGGEDRLDMARLCTSNL